MRQWHGLVAVGTGHSPAVHVGEVRSNRLPYRHGAWVLAGVCQERQVARCGCTEIGLRVEDHNVFPKEEQQHRCIGVSGGTINCSSFCPGFSCRPSDYRYKLGSFCIQPVLIWSGSILEAELQHWARIDFGEFHSYLRSEKTFLHAEARRWHLDPGAGVGR